MLSCGRGPRQAEAMVELTRDIIEAGSLTDRVRSHEAGAVVVFLGTVREFTSGKQTVSLEYEAYPEMASRKMNELEQEARNQWPIVQSLIVHRVGRLALGDVSVGIAVSCPHRREAFEACQFMIDRIKEVVPIWKCEHWANGETEWVHPGLDEVLKPARPANQA